MLRRGQPLTAADSAEPSVAATDSPLPRYHESKPVASSSSSGAGAAFRSKQSFDPEAAVPLLYSNGEIPTSLYDDDKDLKRKRQACCAQSLASYPINPKILCRTPIPLIIRSTTFTDEAHFGKFASQYLKREFYFDVHPPMGKMLLGLSGYLSFYNGSFSFESGKDYPPDVNYTGMRVFCGLFGAFMVPIAYFTGIQLHMSKRACILLACMVTYEIAILEISRFILLDSMLLFFTAFSVYCLAVFRNYQVTAPFSKEWFIWMAMSGLSLGMVTSLTVFQHTIEDLWEMFGDLKMHPMTYLKHWYYRVMCLIILPVAFYAFNFYLHFWILNHSGSGDGQMSSLFQANLIGNKLNENPPNIAYLSTVTIKSSVRGGALLHSHKEKFPDGSQQQQVTAYHHQDANNKWVIHRAWDKDGKNADDPKDAKPVLVKSGDEIRLSIDICITCSHKVPAPITKKESEVSAFGNNSFGDENDVWIIEVVDVNLLSTAFFLTLGTGHSGMAAASDHKFINYTICVQA
ncbi:Protein O-mannosyltransferase 2 [Entophlyctis luteolus]|nr:Protein O-mannosyltransferase 2 [Entophlyctis luteolus]